MVIAASDGITAIVGATASFVGLVVGACMTLKVERDRRTAEARSDLTRALAKYMQACELVSVEIAQLPAPSWIERQVDRIPSRRIGFATQRALSRVVFGRRLEQVRDLYQEARAEVVLLAPIVVIGIALQMDDLFREWEENRTPDWVHKWSALRDELRLTAQTTVDAQLGRAYRAGEKRLTATEPARAPT
jgi:hypothetical protein